jgi:hypothetical protein
MDFKNSELIGSVADISCRSLVKMMNYCSFMFSSQEKLFFFSAGLGYLYALAKLYNTHHKDLFDFSGLRRVIFK